VTASLPPSSPQPSAPARASEATRQELLKLLDRETAIARATDGRLAVLIIELRRVDRLQALLRGPAPSTTMELVLDRLRKALREDDCVAAISDEQACVILPRLAHPSQAVLAAVKLLRALDRPIAHEGGSAVLRPCVGVSTLPEHGFDPAQLLMTADVARHIAATREEGYHVYQGFEAVEDEVYRGLDLDLERAIRANELEVWYQPQLDLESGIAVAAEALVRWRHLKAGEIPPTTVVGIAERTGLMSALNFYILNAALRQASQWRAQDIAPQIAVNLSIGMLTDRELPSVIDQALRTWGAEATQLTLEVAESSMIADAERSGAVLTRLKALGVRLAIDDFGSGYTSLAHLRRLPIDELKIDRPFVGRMLEDEGDRALVRSAIDLGHHFGMRVVAEGVETPAVRDAVSAAGCDVIQGNLVSLPLRPPAFRDWWIRTQRG
jgi:EAL domain-containing protein (putative c-di-GMP-specific phosphodiesterase class I)/GGDEF domain-containing protein